MDIASHKKRPEISIDQHVKRRVVELGRSIESRAAIYLDTKFWIMLRECAVGNNGDQTTLELLEYLRRLVKEGKAFCPISESTFLEFMKQDDVISRLSTAHLVDELSLGITLIDHQVRLGTEVAHFIYSFQFKSDDIHPLRHLVWSKLAYALGFVHPRDTGFDAETELAIQKAFFDRMWTISLEEMVRDIETHSLPDDLIFDVSELNEGIKQNADHIKSFTQAYTAELRGVVELGADIAVNVSNDLSRKRTGEKPAERGSEEWQKCWNQWANLLFLALKKRSHVKLQLRTLHIHALLHAAFRWDKARRFTSNDLYDFQHASAALAYCQAFFTEHALRSTIAARNVALDKLFHCHVASEPLEAIEMLKVIEVEYGRMGVS